jgi:signal transduction histidine kinase
MARRSATESVGPYMMAAATVVLAGSARHYLDPFLGSNRPFLIFFAAVAMSAWLGGRGPALFAIVLSYLAANWFFIEPHNALSFDPTAITDWVNLLSFLVIALIIVASIEAMRRARQRADLHAAHVQSLLEAARQADRRKDEFLATLAHELRNPLAPLSNALQLWSMREPEPAEANELRAIMARQVKQMSRLIDDLMDISRIKRGRIQLHLTRCELRPLVEEAIEAVGPLIDQFGHRLRARLPDEPIWIQADQARITQVFTNLLFNAAKHTGTHRTIEVIVERMDDNAIVRVRDNGPGIPPEMLTKIFEPFTQISEVPSRNYAGLGMGLALVKQLVTLHCGTVEALSEGVGWGSEFVVTLPECSATDGRRESQQLAASSKSRAIARHKIVVTDDIRESAVTLAKMLETLGQDVLVAHDGLAAIDTVSAEHSDMAIVDIAMPGMDGYEVARRLRAQPNTQDMVLVALTGYGQEHDRRRALDAGFDYHLTKPANVEQLQELLQTF